MHALISSQVSTLMHVPSHVLLFASGFRLAITSLLPAINVPFPWRFPMVTSRHNCPIAGAPFPAVAAACDVATAAAGGRWAVSPSSPPVLQLQIGW